MNNSHNEGIPSYYKRSTYILVVFLSSFLPSCTLIGPNRGVDVVSNPAKINFNATDPKQLEPMNVDTIALTQRHYRAIEYCQKAVGSVPKLLLESLKPLTPEQRSALKWPSRIESYNEKSCDSFRIRGEIMDDLNEIFASKSQRVGIILPPIGTNESVLKIILDQIRTELIQSGFNPDKTMIVRRAEKNFDAALKTATELAHLDRVSIIVGGLHSSHAAAIAQTSDLAQTPALIINANSSLGVTKQSMRVYPPLKRLASTLADTMKKYNVQDASVLYPTHANLELFKLLKAVTGVGISYSEASYDPDNPQSILTAIKNQTSKLASSTGRPAVLIFDNFRMVRHIVNIVSTSLPNRNILFAGNQQWRSPALVTPPEESLQGAMFVDFIGNYRNLPARIDVPISDNDYFTTAQAASKIDYQIIGHRLGSIISDAMKYNLNRHEIAFQLQSTKNKWDNYFPSHELAFDPQRDSSWPVFLFEVQNDHIKEL